MFLKTATAFCSFQKVVILNMKQAVSEIIFFLEQGQKMKKCNYLIAFTFSAYCAG